MCTVRSEVQSRQRHTERNASRVALVDHRRLNMVAQVSVAQQSATNLRPPLPTSRRGQSIVLQRFFTGAKTN